MPFVSPYRFTNMDELLKERLGKPEVSSEGNPKKFIDRSDSRYQESIYAEPSRFPTLDTGTIATVGGGVKNLIAKPLSLSSFQKSISQDKRLSNLIRVDAIGQEGTTLPPGQVQITVVGNHPMKGGSFNTEADHEKILEKLKEETIKWSKPISNLARPGGKYAQAVA
jgi:hypothetical protein